LLNKHRWLPCNSKTISTTYPEWLPFQSTNSLYKAEDLYPSSAAELLGAVGSSLSLIIPGAIKSCLRFRPTALHDYSGQLESIMNHFQHAENQKSHFLICSLYALINQTYSVDEIRKSFSAQNINDQIWFGTNFVPISKLVLDPPFNLFPYAEQIPLASPILKFERILQALNIQSRSTETTLLNVLNDIVQKYETNAHDRTLATRNDDFDLIRRILVWFSSFASQEKSETSIDIIKQLYLPTITLNEDNKINSDSNKNVSLSFAIIDECYYCDQKWMTDKLAIESILNEFKLNIVDENIPVDISEVLGVQPLTSKIMNVKSLSFVRNWGQKEEITSRIHNLIKVSI
ncbi:unnamed protein product, partial [Didymodactylos carnosus]